MAYSIKNQLYLNLRFGYQDFPFEDPQSDLNFVHITEGTEQALPYLSISLKDNSRWLAQNRLLAEGTVIDLAFYSGSAENANPEYYEFLMVAHQVDEAPGAIQYRIDGILRAPAFFSQVPLEGIRGSSSYVMKTLAESMNWKFDGVGTSDTMVWYASGRPLYKFARYVTEHGFTTESGCLALAVNMNKVLRYYDVTSMGTPVATFGLLQFLQDGIIPVTSFAPQETAGGSNYVSGYAMHGVEHQLDGEAMHVKNKTVATQVNEEGSLTVNTAAKALVTNGRTTHYPVSRSDNTHPDFHRAEYQNARVSMLFNSRCDIVVPMVVAAQVLDTVTFDTTVGAKEEGAGLTRHSGTYRVFRKVTYITPGSIRTKLSLMRRTADAGAEQKNPPKIPKSLLVNPQVLKDRLPVIPASVNAVVADIRSYSGYLAAAGAAASAGMAAYALLQQATTEGVKTAAETGSQFEPLITTLFADIDALVATAVTEITAIRTPAGRTVITIPLMETRYATLVTAVDLLITERSPAIGSEARKAIELASIGQDVASTLNATGSGGMAAAQQSAGQLGAALSAAGGSTTSAVDLAAQQAALAGAAATNAAANAATNTAAQTSMTDLHTRASAWQATIQIGRNTRLAQAAAVKDAP